MRRRMPTEPPPTCRKRCRPGPPIAPEGMVAWDREHVREEWIHLDRLVARAVRRGDLDECERM